MEEVRKDIPWYEWYQASNTWLIRTKNENKWRSRIKMWVLSPYISNTWYPTVKLQLFWKRKSITVHKLITLTFLWIRSNWLFVNHIDWKKNNNHLSNLEYVTQSENELHAYRLGLKNAPKNMLWIKWKDNPNSKLILQIDKYNNIVNTYRWITEAREKTWLKHISACLYSHKTGKITAWWYKRKYADNSL